MPNLLLTEKCVRSCPYCFAKEYLKKSKANLLSWENLIYIADLLEFSKEKHLSLLGGEPALHPDFVDFVLYLHQRNFHVNVFTSGIMSAHTLETAQNYLLKIPVENLSFVCNYNHPDSSTAKETKQINRFFKTFSKYISLSFNLYQKDFDFTFLVDAIIKYNLKKHIRLGLAQPIPGQKNECLNLNEIRGMAENFRNQLDILEQNRITLGFDCGMPLCIFSNDDIGRLFKLNKGRVVFSCGPAIDIGPDMQTWACFPLANYEKKSLYDFDNVEDIKKYFATQNKQIREERNGIFEECRTCTYFNELCMGGCLAHLINE
ncbi:MAG: radical SAM protein [Bacteroidetes bacterium]|nr:radical SAM protein [Bacteroidota bacterium]MCL1968345.1 radical SAM protein [Bacteroidota bacterium]